MKAADAAGYGICIAFGEFDSEGMLVNGTERTVHSPTAWNGTGQPDVTYVDSDYFLPSEGKPAKCQTWNGEEFVAG